MSDAALLERLDSFDPAERREALGDLNTGFPPSGENHNMHIHSFCSYNGWDYSPSHIVYRSRKEGLAAAALCDFDVLDGMEEFLEAGLTLGLRTAVHLETRAYLAEFGDVDINSPGEAGVTYIMGAGFVRLSEPGSPQATTLQAFRDQARERNELLIERINRALPEIAVDYGADVLPLTPSGNATERHIIRAYVDCANRKIDSAALSAFWADILKRPESAVRALLADRPSLEDAVRAALVKRGGIGYRAPTPETFPPADDFLSWVRSCRAIPMLAWLDGTTGGESDAGALLDCLVAKGAGAVNIIPDRNWNLKDLEEATLKRQKLKEFVEAATDRDLPINIGTEMNKRGLPFVDDLSGPVLKPYAEVFRSGALVMVGQSLLLRFADLSYVDDRAAELAGRTADSKNQYFRRVGALPALSTDQARRLEDMGADRGLKAIDDSVRRGAWTV